MEADLVAAGDRVRVTEDCLNGRLTAWDDPFKPGRNGLEGLEQRIEINSPLALVIVMRNRHYKAVIRNSIICRRGRNVC